jgi:hypothetical protein
MSVAITVVPAAPIHVTSACRINVTGATVADSTAYDKDKYPTMPDILYYLSFEVGGKSQGKSQVFGVAADGTFEFNSYIFPTAGSWTVHLRKVSDDSSVANQAVTVS